MVLYNEAATLGSMNIPAPRATRICNIMLTSAVHQDINNVSWEQNWCMPNHDYHSFIWSSFNFPPALGCYGSNKGHPFILRNDVAELGSKSKR